MLSSAACRADTPRIQRSRDSPVRLGAGRLDLPNDRQNVCREGVRRRPVHRYALRLRLQQDDG